MSELSTHLFRDKKSDDLLERILEPWGYWRAWGVAGLSSPRKSPIEGYNMLETAFTDSLDKKKRKTLSLSEYREWRIKIKTLILPKETRKRVSRSPNYNGHKHNSRVDKLLSGIHGPYYNILIRRYEDGWELNDFMKEWGRGLKYASNNISRARKAAKKVLRINGFKV